MYECAIEMCDELRQQYAEEMFNYSQLPNLLQKMATYYDKILKEARFAPQYFRVAFYGRDFPSFLQDKVTIQPIRIYKRDFIIDCIQIHNHCIRRCSFIEERLTSI